MANAICSGILEELALREQGSRAPFDAYEFIDGVFGGKGFANDNKLATNCDRRAFKQRTTRNGLIVSSFLVVSYSPPGPEVCLSNYYIVLVVLWTPEHHRFA
jgi:hypothetical protein